MLETLDDAVFAGLEDAYGPAVDVPGRLRTLATGSAEEASIALGELGAGIFHQGSYYPAAAPAVPFLVEIVSAPTPARASVLRFLADMSGAPPDAPEPFDPYVFRSTPGAPDYPEATSTIDAILRGKDVFVGALEADDARVRAMAAFLVSGIAREPDALARALARETDESTEIVLRIALARMGRPLPSASRPLPAAVTRVLETRELDEDALGALLRAPRVDPETLPFFSGDLSALAIARLGAHGDRAWSLLHSAFEARLARGERFVETPSPPPQRVCDERAPARTSFDDYGRDAPLRGLLAAMVAIAFGERARSGALLRREDLDPRMRSLLELGRDQRVPVPVGGAPWHEASVMTRFLEGGGALDREVEHDGVRAPLFVHLHPLVHEQRKDDVDRLVRALASAWTDDALFDLVADIMRNGYDLSPYGSPAPPIDAALRAHVIPRLSPTTMRARYEALAGELARLEYVASAPARFALTPWIDEGVPPPVELDPLVLGALLFMRAEGVPWLRTFAEPRRSAIVTRHGNAYTLQLFADACDGIEDGLVRGFLLPGCDWLLHDAEAALGRLGIDRLRAIAEDVSGTRATIVRRVLRDKTREGILVLTMNVEGDAVRASLVDWTGATRLDARWSVQPMPEEVTPVVAACADVVDPLVDLAGDLEHGTRYRVMRVLADAGFHGTIRDGSSSLRTGSP